MSSRIVGPFPAAAGPGCEDSHGLPLENKYRKAPLRYTASENFFRRRLAAGRRPGRFSGVGPGRLGCERPSRAYDGAGSGDV